jgi:hypothetical protein
MAVFPIERPANARQKFKILSERFNQTSMPLHLN